MSEPLTHSDLIYLFVDGEASPAERSKLYDALANNPDLQMEFEDAMRMKAAVEREVTAAIPPPSLTESLFVRAGVALPAATSAIAPAVPAISNLANSGWFALAKTFALPALVVGSAVTYGVVKMTENNAIPQQPAAITRTIENHPSLPQMVGRTEMNAVTLPEGELVKNQSLNTKESQKNVSSIANIVTPVATAEQPEVVLNQNNSSTNTPTQVAIQEEASIASIPSASINEVSPMSISNVGDEGAKITHNPLAIRDKSTPKDQTGITVSAERYFGSSYIQDRSGKIPSASTLFNNTTLSVMFFKPAEQISVGAAGGEESFPLYLLKENGKINADPTLKSFGIATEYSPFNIAGVNVTTREILGASVEGAGIINKLKAGLNYNLTEAVNISAGYEWTELFYNSHNTTLGAGKTAWTAGLSYTF